MHEAERAHGGGTVRAAEDCSTGDTRGGWVGGCRRPAAHRAHGEVVVPAGEACSTQGTWRGCSDCRRPAAHRAHGEVAVIAGGRQHTGHMERLQ